MTIEAGALSLRISETGADAVLAKLNQIDQKARALGNATQGVKFNAASSTGASGELQRLSATFTQVQQAADKAAPAVDRASGASERAAKAGKTVAAALGDQILGYYSLHGIVNKVIAISDEFNAAADRQAIGQMKLSAVARLTGTSLDFVGTIAAQAQDKFKIGIGQAAELTSGFVRLAARSGDVSKSGQLMAAWMDLGAANGLTLDQTLQALETTLGGNDEGLNKLGLANPSQIWKKWADAAGTTVGQLTEQQKWLALVNESIAQGAKVNGEYGKSLDSVPGKQREWNAALEKFNAHIGTSIGGTRAWAYEIGTTLANAFVNFDSWLDRMAAKTSKWLNLSAGLGFIFAGIKPGVASPAEIVAGTRNVDPALLKAQLDAAAGLGKAAPHVPTAAERKAAEEAAAAAREARLQALGGRATVTGGIMTEDYKTQIAQLIGAPTVGVDGKGKMKGVKAFSIADIALGSDAKIKEQMETKKAFISGLLTDVAGSVGGAFGDAFTAAFSGDDNFFAALGKGLLRSLGNMIMQLGESMVEYALLTQVLSAVPGPWQALGWGAVATGAAGLGLIALGAGMGALGGKGGKGGHGGGGGGRGGSSTDHERNQWDVAFDPDHKLRKRSGPAVIPSARGIDNTPMPTGPGVVNIGVINTLHPDNAEWQRTVSKTVSNARARGLRG